MMTLIIDIFWIFVIFGGVALVAWLIISGGEWLADRLQARVRENNPGDSKHCALMTREEFRGLRYEGFQSVDQLLEAYREARHESHRWCMRATVAEARENNRKARDTNLTASEVLRREWGRHLDKPPLCWRCQKNIVVTEGVLCVSCYEAQADGSHP